MGILKRNTPAADKNEAAAAPTPSFEDMDANIGGQAEDTAAAETQANAAADAPAAEAKTEKVERVAAEPVDEAPRSAGKPADKASKTIEGEARVVEDSGKAEAKPTPQKTEPAAKPQRAVVAATGNLPTLLSAGASVNVLAALENALEKSGITVEYGMFPRIRLDTGVLATAEGAEAGSWIELQVISYGKSWAVGIGEDTKDSKELVRYSADGVTIDQPLGDKEDEWAGKLCTDYREYLIGQGHEKAKIAEYTIVYGIAVAQEQMDFKHAMDLVQLQLPPSSGRDWRSYVMNRAIHARIGKIKETSGNPVVRFTTERVKSDAKSFYKITPSHGIASPVDFGTPAEQPEVAEAEA